MAPNGHRHPPRGAAGPTLVVTDAPQPLPIGQERGASLLDTAARKEMLSIAYVRAVAAQAGYAVSPGPCPDRDSVDLKVHAGGAMHPSIDLQLKATTTLPGPQDGRFPFRLKIKNYDDLRDRTLVPRLLVVLSLPGNEDDWLEVTPERLAPRRCAYWMTLRGFAERTNTESVTVHIPETNIFDTRQLSQLIEKVRAGHLR